MFRKTKWSASGDSVIIIFNKIVITRGWVRYKRGPGKSLGYVFPYKKNYPKRYRGSRF